MNPQEFQLLDAVVAFVGIPASWLIMGVGTWAFIRWWGSKF